MSDSNTTSTLNANSSNNGRDERDNFGREVANDTNKEEAKGRGGRQVEVREEIHNDYEFRDQYAVDARPEYMVSIRMHVSTYTRIYTCIYIYIYIYIYINVCARTRVSTWPYFSV